MTPAHALALDVDAVTRASQLIDAGHDAAAAVVADRILAALDPATAAPDAHAVTAVGVYLACIPESAAGRTDLPVQRAGYAVRACRDLYGLADPHTITALHRLLWALCMRCTITWVTPRPGLGLAATWRLLVRAATALHGPDAAETFDYRHHRGIALHQVGHCETATKDLIRTCRRWHANHGTADTTILHTIATIVHACRIANDFAGIWLRHQLLAVPAAMHPRILDGLTAGHTPARTVTHRVTYTHDRLASGPLTDAGTGYPGVDLSSDMDLSC